MTEGRCLRQSLTVRSLLIFPIPRQQHISLNKFRLFDKYIIDKVETSVMLRNVNYTL